MYGLINRALENFLKERHGAALWQRVVQRAQSPFDGFEPLLTYDAALTDALVTAAADLLGQTRETVLEDLGTELVSHRDRDGLRRLLRFGGVSFRDFLHSLEELPDRARLALPYLELPALALQDHGAGRFTLRALPYVTGAGYILMGLLRAMADDYGALVVLDLAPSVAGVDVIQIHVLDEAFAEGRPFDLAAGTV
ncbi:heme NO-binding domain-containing protein [Pseudotabrizicola formosa]|uniref:heme NO-binding domain-containing protein n=1 Tax=Pseudotabrizicola formosa TaxID=2030009 RepID=UPI000CD24A6A|nr:heme NO-binding domain-containing protein [Pseudotabrizicola formosa]